LEGDFLRIDFKDTGHGISEEDKQKIFEPFFTTKDPGEGSGLGLSVSRNIIDTHKGLMSVTSQLAKGTKVTIFFKIAETNHKGGTHEEKNPGN
jgi:hypothetical protein